MKKKQNSKYEISSYNFKVLSLETVIEQFPGHIYWKDRDFVFIGCNTANWKDFGFKSLSEYIGKNDYDIFSKEEADGIRLIDEEVVNTGKIKIAEEESTLYTGQKKLYLSHKVPLKDNNGEIIGILGISLDVTDERKETANKLRVLENIIAMMPSNVYWMNRDGVYLGCNDNEAKAIGLASRYDIVGKKNTDIPGFLLPEALDPTNKQVIEQGKTVVLEEPAILLDGTKATFISSKAPLRNNADEIIGMVGISVDITDRKKIEEELLVAKERAETADTIKTQFIQNMEHDLRTPASGVAQVLHILSEEETDPNKKDTLQKLAAASQRLLDLLNDIVAFDKASLGEVAIMHYRFDLYDVVQSIVDMETPTAQSKNVTLKVEIADDIPQNIVGDRNRIHRILLNLVGNAVKFTVKGYVKISLSRGKKIDAKRFILKIVVEDTGIGISENKRRIIYEKFERGSPSNRGLYKGAGLGLSITKQFIDELQGEIEVESAQGVGTTFTCFIPCSMTLVDIADYNSIYKKFQVLRTPLAAEPLKVKAIEDSEVLDTKFNKIRILVVEDDPMAQLAARSTLEGKLGSNFILAKTGAEALALTAKNKYDR